MKKEIMTIREFAQETGMKECSVRRFGVKTLYKVRIEALNNAFLTSYPIPENKRIIKFIQEHYASSIQVVA